MCVCVCVCVCVYLKGVRGQTKEVNGVVYRQSTPSDPPQVFSMDIMRHKDSVDELVKTGKAIMDSKNPEEKEILKVIRMNQNITIRRPTKRQLSLWLECTYLIVVLIDCSYLTIVLIVHVN